MDLEHVQVPIDGVDQTEPSCQEVKSANAAESDALHAFGDFVVDVAGGEGGSARIAEACFVEAALRQGVANGACDGSVVGVSWYAQPNS
jgi:hypothetical protein